RADPEAAGRARPGRRVHAVPLQHAAAVHGHRPDQGRIPGTVARLGIFLTPVFFYVLQWFGGGRPTGARPRITPGATNRCWNQLLRAFGPTHHGRCARRAQQLAPQTSAGRFGPEAGEWRTRVAAQATNVASAAARHKILPEFLSPS